MTTLSSIRKNRQKEERTAGLDSAEVAVLAGGSNLVFSTLDSLPASDLTPGQKALVEDVNRLYLTDGVGWYNVGFNVNANPRWITEPDAEVTITDSATPLIITALAADSDGTNLINQSSVIGDSAQYMVTISNDSSVWTFTPKSADSIGIEVAAGNLVESNGDFIYNFKWSDGINYLQKNVTITYQPAGGGLDWAGARGFFLGGWSDRDNLDYFTIATDTSVTAGSNLTSSAANGDNAVSTGELIIIPKQGTDIMAFSSPTLGTASNFATSRFSRNADYSSAAGNGERGIWRGGNSSYYNIFDWMTLTSGAQCAQHSSLPSQFGTADAMAGNSTKALSGMGTHTSDYGGTERCYYVLYDTTGTAYNFGNLGYDATRPAAAGDETHGIWAGGGHANTISVYSGLTTATYDTGGSAISGGSISRARKGGLAMSDKTYFIHAGGFANGNLISGARNDIDKRVIATGSNATLIGSLSQATSYGSGASGNAA
tara:strand:+ start:116 stop:1576 length:1461 start_codon:yes stop_codon:yes gene_type:complete